jgi:hypothetical protein
MHKTFPGPRRIASAARVKFAALAHRTQLAFPAGGAVHVRGILPHDEETARAGQQTDIADLAAGTGLIYDLGLVEAGALPRDTNEVIGLSSLLYTAHLLARCGVEVVDLQDEDGAPLALTPHAMFSLLMADSDAARLCSDWALAPEMYWAKEGNVSGSLSNPSGVAAQNPAQNLKPPLDAAL